MMAIMQIPARTTEFFPRLTTKKYLLLLLINVLLGLGTFSTWRR